ncbi:MULTISPECIES: iron-sulfur cluster repair di-iron protein [Exiguobacterium]|uniref:iron-sulfur cluster repair di-iron protein n=1 Tax=Exiguobacterium TaxID=33986 RepID=UPI001BE88E2F|nr:MULTISPECIES: iron-sulfur cluster repair di-iron protein [Exiguobacterium]MCT4783239.1 iron-sulfur cluster repair di-iron protein [Exiguobacterium himgiriensis]
MIYTFTSDTHVSDIVKQCPQAADIFKRNRIDFCCGGNRPLAEATDKSKRSTEEILEEVNALYKRKQEMNETSIDWDAASSSELVEHIIHKHHQFLTDELPQLTPYVTKVFRVHGQHHPHLGQVHQLFNQLKLELEQHIVKEETKDFPTLLRHEAEPTEETTRELETILASLESEHAAAGDLLKTLRHVTNDFTPPEGACGTYRLVYQRLEALEADTFEHIHLENNILFPRARTVV